MEWHEQALHLLGELKSVGEQAQGAILRGDVSALPVLVRREAELAGSLSRLLEEVPAAVSGGAAGDPYEELRRQARAWRRLHEQNRMLLEHAHQTVVALIGLLTGAGMEPSGLYSADGMQRRSAAARPGDALPAAAVDQRV
ncbi:MAG: hypothetical protein AB1609_11780 [Bacillota bacterium]